MNAESIALLIDNTNQYESSLARFVIKYLFKRKAIQMIGIC